jgi:YbbR domain-containing protein
LRITLDSLKTKRVPVKEKIEIQFKPQFDLKDSVSISPNEVEITGPAAVLDTVSYLYTKPESFEKLDADIEKMIEIIVPEKTVIRPEKVMLKIPVERFTEKKIKIPISVKNKPADKYLKLFPSEVELITLVGLSEFENVKNSNFEVFVDFEKIDQSNENLSVSVRSNVSQLKIIRFTPESVEYLIESD